MFLLAAACGDDAAAGGDGGSADAAASGQAGDKGGAGEDADHDAAMGGNAGNGGGDQDAAVSGNAGTGGGSEPTCDGIAGKTPTWKVIDPKLPDLESSQDQTSADPAVKGLAGVAYGNGTFVALGTGSGQDVFRYATSSDGEHWTAHSEKLANASTLYSISAIHFREGKFVFFAEHLNDGFHVHSSTDGTSWDDAIVETGARAIVDEFDASPDAVVYAGNNGDMRSSADLTTWDKRSDTAAGGFDFMDIAFGGGLWISTGNAATPGWFSKDGKSWTAFAAGVLGSARVEYGNDLWLAQVSGQAGPEIHTSKDGKKFSKLTTTGYDTGYQVRFTGGHFTTISFAGLHPDHEVLVSDDGKDWTKFGSFAPVPKRDSDGAAANMLFRETQFGNCRYVIAGTLQYSPMPMLGQPYILTNKPLIVLGTFE